MLCIFAFKDDSNLMAPQKRHLQKYSLKLDVALF